VQRSPGAEVCDSDDLCAAAPAEPACALEPLLGKLSHLPLDQRVVRLAGTVRKKSRRPLVIAPPETFECHMYKSSGAVVVDVVAQVASFQSLNPNTPP
jgi:hypothetical protein